jgi:hypothetical protein
MYIVYDWFEKIYLNYSRRYCPLTLSLWWTLQGTSNPDWPISFHMTKISRIFWPIGAGKGREVSMSRNRCR